MPMPMPIPDFPLADNTAITTDGRLLHEIDLEDVSISKAAVRMVIKAAGLILAEHMPAVDPDKMTTSQAVAMFVDRLFWEAGSGGLIMCSEVKSKTYCLPIPREHWSMHREGFLH